MKYISIFAIPVIVLIVIVYGFYKKVDIYDTFIEGAKDGLTATLTIFPYMIAMVFATNLFIKSGVIEFSLSFARTFFNILKFPVEVIPMALLRPISGSATLGILNNIYDTFGPDSYIGRLASTIQGCTDTTFYVITLYFGSVKISKIRHSLKVGLFADLVGIVASILIVSIVFS